MLNKVKDFIAQHQLISRDGLHIVALSGGADSVALLLILRELGYRIEAAHCNFHLRGTESDRDEAFVKSLCDKLGIPLHLIHFDSVEYAHLHQVSLEMACRDLRYGYFRQLRTDLGAETVCVAHHRDDAVETMLMNLLRGSGIHGLTGMRVKNDYVVRPLLGLSRQEIEEYLHSIGQDFVTDSTNLVDDVVRNKIRLNVLPLLKTINPSAADSISRSAGYLQEAEKVLSDAIEAQKARLIRPNVQDGSETVAVSDLLQLPSPSYFLHEWLAPYGFNATQTTQMMSHIDGESGRAYHSATHTLYVDRQSLVLAPHQEPMKTLKIPETGLYRYDDDLRFDVSYTDDLTVSKRPDCVTLDASTVKFPLTVRPIAPGDRFVPFGMTGHKLVSDFMTDLKLPILQKRRPLVVTDKDGEILWLTGLRSDNLYRISEQTTSVLRIAIR